ncbi:Uncharacterised protein [Yersinia ruckeri]|nr:Uncharacterised protein [Yersinia ruckeri]
MVIESLSQVRPGINGQRTQRNHIGTLSGHIPLVGGDLNLAGLHLTIGQIDSATRQSQCTGGDRLPLCNQVITGCHRQITRGRQFAIALYTRAQQAVAVAIQPRRVDPQIAFGDQATAPVIQITRQLQIEICRPGLRDHAVNIGQCVCIKRHLLGHHVGLVGAQPRGRSGRQRRSRVDHRISQGDIARLGYETDGMPLCLTAS